MASKKSEDHGLEQAMALLIQNQAAFVGQLNETNKRFSRIEDYLQQIKAILLRHEQTLQALPEAIRDKIGFKPASE